MLNIQNQFIKIFYVISGFFHLQGPEKLTIPFLDKLFVERNNGQKYENNTCTFEWNSTGCGNACQESMISGS